MELQQEETQIVVALEPAILPAENENLLYWKRQKDIYESELKCLLVRGLAFPELNENQQIDWKSCLEQSKVILDQQSQLKFCFQQLMWKIQSKSCDLLTLAQEMQKMIVQKFQIEIKDCELDKVMNMINEAAEKKNYGIQHGYKEDFQVFEVWELKQPMKLLKHTNLDELTIIQQKRKVVANLLQKLQTLCKQIDKLKNGDSFNQVDSAFSSYKEAHQQYKKPIEFKGQAKPSGKINQSTKKLILEDSIKQLQIDSDKQEVKDPLNKLENQIFLHTTPDKVSTETSENTQSVNKNVQKRPNSKPKKPIESKEKVEQEKEEGGVIVVGENVVPSISKTVQITKHFAQNSKKRGTAAQEVNKKNEDSNLTISEASVSVDKLATTIVPPSSQVSKPKEEQQPQNQSQQKNSIFNYFKPDSKQASDVTTLNKHIQNPQGGVIKSSRFKGFPAEYPKDHINFNQLHDINKLDEVLQVSVDFKNQMQLELKQGERYFELIKYQLSELMRQMKNQFLIKKQIPNNRRQITILLHDSQQFIKNSIFAQNSAQINPRNPLNSKDQDLINYDIDSEEEIQELNAEDIENCNASVDEEQKQNEVEEDSFFVSDGYVSMMEDEQNSDDCRVFRSSGHDKKENLDFRQYDFVSNRDKVNNSQNEYILFNQDHEMFSRFIIRPLQQCNEFPIKVKKDEDLEGQTSTGQFVDHFLDLNILKDFSRLIHGSYENKDTLRAQFLQKYPSVSTHYFKKKMKQLCDNEEKNKWTIKKSILEELGILEECQEIRGQQQADYQASKQELEQKKEREKKQKKEMRIKEQKEKEKQKQKQKDKIVSQSQMNGSIIAAITNQQIIPQKQQEIQYIMVESSNGTENNQKQHDNNSVIVIQSSNNNTNRKIESGVLNQINVNGTPISKFDTSTQSKRKQQSPTSASKMVINSQKQPEQSSPIVSGNSNATRHSARKQQQELQKQMQDQPQEELLVFVEDDEDLELENKADQQNEIQSEEIIENIQADLKISDDNDSKLKMEIENLSNCQIQQ